MPKRKRDVQKIFSVISFEKTEKTTSEAVFGVYSSVDIAFQKILDYLNNHWTSASLTVETQPYMLSFDFDCEWVNTNKILPSEPRKKKVSYFMRIEYLDDEESDNTSFFPEYENPDYFIQKNEKHWKK